MIPAGVDCPFSTVSASIRRRTWVSTSTRRCRVPRRDPENQERQRAEGAGGVHAAYLIDGDAVDNFRERNPRLTVPSRPRGGRQDGEAPWSRSARPSLSCFSAAATSAAAALPQPPSPIFATTLSGSVKDDAGRVLEGVEILILAPEGGGDGALLRAVSDAGGRFVVGAVNPGVYRVAAIKSGYAAALGRVNTDAALVGGSGPPTDSQGRPARSRRESWTIFRGRCAFLRRASFARWTSARAPRIPRHGRRRGAFAARIEDSVRGEVDHMVAVGSWRPGASGPSSSLEGNETRMRFGRHLGERGAIQVRGRRGSLDSSSPPSAPGASAAGASDVDLDLSYDTERRREPGDASVLFGRRSRADRSTGRRRRCARRQGQRSWGYDAKWRKQVDAVVARRPSSRIPRRESRSRSGTRSAGIPPKGTRPTGRSAREGSYENLVGDGHPRAPRRPRAAAEPVGSRGSPRTRRPEAFALDGAIRVEPPRRFRGPVVRGGPRRGQRTACAVHQGFDATPDDDAGAASRGIWTRAAWKREPRSRISRRPAPRRAGRNRGRRPPVAVRIRRRAEDASRPHADRFAGRRPTCRRAPIVWRGQETADELEALYVTDGFASDRFVALDLERVAPSRDGVLPRRARPRRRGARAGARRRPGRSPVRSRDGLRRGAARRERPRAGSAVSIEYRAIREHAAVARRPSRRTRFGRWRWISLSSWCGLRAAVRRVASSSTARSALGNGPVDSRCRSDRRAALRRGAQADRRGTVPGLLKARKTRGVGSESASAPHAIRRHRGGGDPPRGVHDPLVRTPDLPARAVDRCRVDADAGGRHRVRRSSRALPARTRASVPATCSLQLNGERRRGRPPRGRRAVARPGRSRDRARPSSGERDRRDVDGRGEASRRAPALRLSRADRRRLLRVGAAHRLELAERSRARVYGALGMALFAQLVLSQTGVGDTFDWAVHWADVIAGALVPALLVHVAWTLARGEMPGRRTVLAAAYGARLALDRRGRLDGRPGWVLSVRAIRSAPPAGTIVSSCGSSPPPSAASAFALARAYARTTSRLHRSQLRWMLWGLGLGFGPFTALYIVPWTFGAAVPSWIALALLPLLAVPAAFTAAMARYRLHDLDLILRRGLVGRRARRDHGRRVRGHAGDRPPPGGRSRAARKPCWAFSRRWSPRWRTPSCARGSAKASTGRSTARGTAIARRCSTGAAS